MRGFETTRWFRTRRFRWSEVSNFAVWGSDSAGFVTFKDKTQRLGIFGKTNAALMSGRNNVLRIPLRRLMNWHGS
jgi:hypothetical protein